MKKSYAVPLLVLISSLALASCNPKPSESTPTSGGNTNTPTSSSDDNILNAPKVDVSVIPTYIETNSSIDLFSVINHQNGVDLKVKIEVSTTEDGSSFSTYDNDFAGYDEQTGIWKPNMVNKVVRLSFDASNSSGKSSGTKSVFVSNKATLKNNPFASSYSINDYIFLNKAFNTYQTVSLNVSRAIVNSADGKSTNVSSDYDPATSKFTFKYKGTYTLIAALDDGLSEKPVTGTFVFDVVEEGQFFEINYLDDLLGKYPTYVAPSQDENKKDLINSRENINYQMPEGYPAGKVATNPTYNYRLTRDLDYLDPNSWEDGVIKPWVPIVNGSTAEQTFSGIIDGAGHTIKNLTNVFPGRSEAKTVKKQVKDETGKVVTKEFTLPKMDKLVDTFGVSLLESSAENNSKGTIKNLNITDYKIEITKEDTQNQVIVANNYSIIDDPYLRPDAYSDTRSTTNLDTINVTGNITVDLTSMTNGVNGSNIGGVSYSANSLNNIDSKVNITVSNTNNTGSQKIGGVLATGNSTGSNISYDGQITANTSSNQPLYVGGIFGQPDYSDAKNQNDNIDSKGTINIHNKVVDNKATGITFVGGIAGSFYGSGSEAQADSYNMTSSMNINVDNLVNAWGGIGGLAGNNMYIYAYSSFYTGNINVSNFDANSLLTNYEQCPSVGGLFGKTQASSFDSGFNGNITIGGQGSKVVGGIAGSLVTGYNSHAGQDPDNEVYGSTWQQLNGVTARGNITIDGGKLQYGGILGYIRNGSETAAGIINSYSNINLVTNDINVDESFGALGVGTFFRNGKKYDYVKIDGSQFVGSLGSLSETNKYLLIAKLDFGTYLDNINDAYKVFTNQKDRYTIQLDNLIEGGWEEDLTLKEGKYVILNNKTGQKTTLNVKATDKDTTPYIDKDGKAKVAKIIDGKVTWEDSYYFNQGLENGSISKENFSKNLFIYFDGTSFHYGVKNNEGLAKRSLLDSASDVKFSNAPVVKNGTWHCGNIDTKVKGEEGQFSYISSANLSKYTYDINAKKDFDNWTYKVSSTEVSSTSNQLKWVPDKESKVESNMVNSILERINAYKAQLDDILKNKYITFEPADDFDFADWPKENIVEQDGKKYIKLPVKDYKEGDLGGLIQTDIALASTFSENNIKAIKADIDRSIQDLYDKLDSFSNYQNEHSNN